jgi:hypothetical protein
MMETQVEVYGVKPDGTTELIGTTTTPPNMRRVEIVEEVFGVTPQQEGYNEASDCLMALELYHEWLVEQGWKGPEIEIKPVESA